MPTGKDANGEPPAREEYEQFLELRRHVRRLQEGSPLLLRTAAQGSIDRDDLQICTFWVTKDLQTLKWREEEGKGPVRELSLGEIRAVEQEDGAGGGASDGAPDEKNFALNLILHAGNSPEYMGLICASPEDLTSWRDGLKFLVGALPPPSPPGAGKRPDVVVAGGVANAASAAVSADGRTQKLKEENEQLQADNKELREMIERKDETIAVLLRDLQNRNTVVDRCNKTESTSRESDEHLRDREVAILQRKIRRLQRELKAKRQTVKDLLDLVGKVTSQQGFESSAVEDVEDEDNEENDEEDGVAELASRRLASSPAAASRGARTEAASGGPGSISRPRGGHVDASAVAVTAEATSAMVGGSASEADAEGAKEELKALHAELSSLESDMLGLRFAPPARSTSTGNVGSGGTTSGNVKAQAAGEGARQSPAEAIAAEPEPPRAKAPQAEPVAKPHPPAPVGAALSVETPSASPSAGAQRGKSVAAPPSVAALEALAREEALLEEKKRLVERLAQSLEPASDGENEEDDGFPLR